MTFAADIPMSEDNQETIEDSNSSGFIDYMEEDVQQVGHFGIADQVATIGAIDNVFQVREKINNLKSQTQAYRAIITSQQNQALDDKSVVEYADNILKILKYCKDILEVTFKEISDLEKRLLFLKMFLEFITTLGVEGEKLQDLLIGILSVLDTAAAFIYDQCFLIGGESEMVNVIKDCMAKVIDSEVIDLLLKSLKSTSSASEFDMIVRIAVDIILFLQDVLRVTLDHGADMNNQVKFLESFLSNKSSQYIEHVKSILSHVEVVFTAHTPKLFSIGELAYISDLSKDLKLIEAEVRILEHLDNTMEPPIKDQTETLLEGLMFMRNYLMSHKMNCSNFSLYKQIEEVAFKGESVIPSIIDNGVKEDLVQRMLEDIKHLKIRASGIYLEPTTLKFPRVNQKAFLDSFLQYLKEDVIPTSNKVALVKQQVMAIHSSLESLETLFSPAIELYNEHDEEFKAIKSRVVDAAFEAEYTIDSFLVRQHPLWYHMLELFQVTEKIKSIVEITEKIKSIVESRITTGIFNKNWKAEHRSTQQMSTHVLPEVNQCKIVGVENEVETIVDKLANGKKEHHVISIVGMPKLGKTALAKAVYYHERLLNHFDVRAWCDLSGVNAKRNLLMGLLNQVGMSAQISDFDDDGDLAQLLKKSLWGRRYLIVMDNLQDITIWEYFQMAFPKENNGSGIIFTTRFHRLVSKLSDQITKFVHLGFFPISISWKLLKSKIFQNDCTRKLEEIGMRIAEKCYGIPFAIHLAVETLRMMEKNPDRWKEEEERLFSHNMTYLNDNILEPSYKDLPENLKLCFVYWGPIIKSEKIPIKKLIRLSIAEQLVQQTPNKSLEDQANDLLLELQTREVLVVAQQISNGKIKKCNIVEQFSEFCLKKCREEHIWELINGSDADTKSQQEPYTQCSRLYIDSNGIHFLTSKPSGSHVRSIIFGVEDMDCDVTCITNNFRLLRVLDFGGINVGNSFPREIELMILLKYLAIHGNFDSIPDFISNLGDLETFLIKRSKAGSKAVCLPHTVRQMRKLRHLHIYPHAVFLLGSDYHGEKSLMLSMESNLQTISTLPLVYDVGNTWTEKEHMQKWLANVRNLKFVVADSSSTSEKCNLFPSLLYLNKLESLKICCSDGVVSSRDFSFPQSLKRLTLSNLALPWDEISIIGKLPELEVLKLLCNAFKGSKWEMTDGMFPRLKYLKLDSADIQQWIGDDDCLPHLEWLALRSCEQLEMIPSCITNNFNLQTIEFWGCSDTIKNLAKEINEERVDIGCELIKVVDHPHRA